MTAFLAESIVLAVVGGIIGCATNSLSISDISLTFRITPVLMAGGLLFTAMIGAVGLLPAIGPARIPIAYPLREI